MLTRTLVLAAAATLLVAGGAMAETFGTGANQFSLSFVPISGATNPSSPIVFIINPTTSSSWTFTGVANDYRMGTYDVTNDQWNKFAASLGVPVTGADGGYSSSSQFTGANVPVNNVSWYEAAQFVNWLNTSTGYQAAYKFTGTQGTSNYTFATWSPSDVGYNSSNPYRNSNAIYYLPTDDEWVKAAYWNGSSLQTYATKDNSFPAQGNGKSGTGWNYENYNNVYATNPPGPWNVGSGSQELNGTYDMMGNVWQWEESPYTSNDYGTAPRRGLRGGSFIGNDYGDGLSSPYWGGVAPILEFPNGGFRVASNAVPEPATLSLLALGGMAMLRRRS